MQRSRRALIDRVLIASRVRYRCKLGHADGFFFSVDPTKRAVFRPMTFASSTVLTSIENEQESAASYFFMTSAKCRRQARRDPQGDSWS